MNEQTYIKEKQKAWAKRHRITLTGSKIVRGEETYTINLNDNLFEPLLPDTRSSLESGDGNELMAPTDGLPKIQALHSSSALGINICQYWQSTHRVRDIAFACGFCDKDNAGIMGLSFEKKLTIHPSLPRRSNIDICIYPPETASQKIYAIESKFSEPYRSGKDHGLRPDYLALNPDPWVDIPNLFALAQQISPTDSNFHYLHAAQLIKHILGLKHNYGKSKFRLLYLYYDVLGEQSCAHRKEIEDFKAIANADGIDFLTLSYQELIIKLIRHFDKGNERYMDYITSRYL